MKLLVFGSRNLDSEKIYKKIKKEIIKKNPKMIVTAAEPSGVCFLTQKIAKELKIPLTVFFANPRYKTGMFEHRCDECLNFADEVLFFWDKESKGTKNEIERAVFFDKKHSIIILKFSDFDFNGF